MDYDIDSYKSLAFAIVQRACEDYINAGARVENHDMKIVANGNRVDNERYTISECRNFFKSDWYQDICDIDSNRIIRICEEKAKEKAKRTRPKRG